MKNIIVYGWYHQKNIGDNLFADAFKHLFPNCNFTFVNNLTESSLNSADAVFFGGGSFLYAAPIINSKHLDLLKSKKIFYIGVGIEDYIHPTHIELIKIAKLIATRSFDQVDRIKQLNNNTIFVPDIVYSLQDYVVKSNKIDKSVLIMSNISVVPKWNDIQWKHSSWNYFKSEFSQFLDYLVENNFSINFFSMCRNKELDDNSATAELVNMMSRRNINYQLTDSPSSFSDITEMLSKYSLIITQRFHGIVLAEMLRTPYMAIHHHDKLKNSIPHDGAFVSYYGAFKQELINQFNAAKNIKYATEVPVNKDVYKDLSNLVSTLL